MHQKCVCVCVLQTDYESQTTAMVLCQGPEELAMAPSAGVGQSNADRTGLNVAARAQPACLAELPSSIILRDTQWSACQDIQRNAAVLPFVVAFADVTLQLEGESLIRLGTELKHLKDASTDLAGVPHRVAGAKRDLRPARYPVRW